MLYVGIEGGIGGGFFGGFLASMMASGLAKPYCCYWNLQTGEFRLLDSGCLYDLLEKYPDLYEIIWPSQNRTRGEHARIISSNIWNGKNRNC